MGQPVQYLLDMLPVGYLPGLTLPPGEPPRHPLPEAARRRGRTRRGGVLRDGHEGLDEVGGRDPRNGRQLIILGRGLQFR